MNILRPINRDKMCFVHVPKCGGQSVKSALERSYNSRLRVVKMNARASLAASQIKGVGNLDLNNYRENVLRYFLSDDRAGLVMGHYPCSSTTREAFHSWNFITILRNPESRFISHYLYNVYKKSDHFKQNQPLDQFLETDRAKSWGKMYLSYFSDLPVDSDLSTAIQDAKNNLDKFSLVGVLEDLDKWSTGMLELFKMKIHIPQNNKSPSGAKAARESISEDEMLQIKRLCEPSMEIYEHVRSKI